MSTSIQDLPRGKARQGDAILGHRQIIVRRQTNRRPYPRNPAPTHGRLFWRGAHISEVKGRRRPDVQPGRPGRVVGTDLHAKTDERFHQAPRTTATPPTQIPTQMRDLLYSNAGETLRLCTERSGPCRHPFWLVVVVSFQRLLDTHYCDYCVKIRSPRIPTSIHGRDSISLGFPVRYFRAFRVAQLRHGGRSASLCSKARRQGR